MTLKLLYTEQAPFSFEESLHPLAPKVSHQKLMKTQGKILEAAETLVLQPFREQRRTIT